MDSIKTGWGIGRAGEGNGNGKAHKKEPTRKKRVGSSSCATDCRNRPPKGRQQAYLPKYSTFAARRQDPVYNLRTDNRSGKAAPGPGHTPGEPPERAAKSGTPAGARRPLAQQAYRTPEPPAGAAGRGGAGENATTRSV